MVGYDGIMQHISNKGYKPVVLHITDKPKTLETSDNERGMPTDCMAKRVLVAL